MPFYKWIFNVQLWFCSVLLLPSEHLHMSETLPLTRPLLHYLISRTSYRLFLETLLPPASICRQFHRSPTAFTSSTTIHAPFIYVVVFACMERQQGSHLVKIA